jgi:hypothetical protein
MSDTQQPNKTTDFNDFQVAVLVMISKCREVGFCWACYMIAKSANLNPKDPSSISMNTQSAKPTETTNTGDE